MIPPPTLWAAMDFPKDPHVHVNPQKMWQPVYIHKWVPLIFKISNFPIKTKFTMWPWTLKSTFSLSLCRPSPCEPFFSSNSFHVVNLLFSIWQCCKSTLSLFKNSPCSYVIHPNVAHSFLKNKLNLQEKSKQGKCNVVLKRT